jgi:PTH1 family peptidyl-tRNA hydrolase
MAIDELAARSQATGRLQADAWVAEARIAGFEALLVKPQSYMNLSGAPVARLLGLSGASPADLVVMMDDVALPLGRLRLREHGSDGGHNGLRSLIETLGTDAFARLRIGVGAAAPLPTQLADFVLGEFQPEEWLKLREVLPLAADAVVSLFEEGAAAAMNRFNGRSL